MEQLHVCPECKYILSDKWDAIWLMKSILARREKIKVYIEKRIIDPDEDSDLTPIYKFLNIENYCCRQHILTQTNMRDTVV